MMKVAIISLVLLTKLLGTASAQQFEFAISVSDGANTQILTLGVHPDGTDGLDIGLDEPAPPPPFPGAFDARFRIDTEDFFKDIRGNQPSQKIFTMLYQEAENEGPIMLAWDANDLPTLFTLEIVDAITCNIYGPLDMSTTTTLDISSTGGLLDAGLKILAKPTTPSAVTRFVATTGSDACNDCTNVAEPCATVIHAVAQANNGDTILLAAGTYNEPGVLIEKALTIQGQGVVVQ